MQDYQLLMGDRYHTVVGSLRILPDVWSPALHNIRDIWVYLPPSYHESDAAYPVIYMHDGQNLFDRSIAFGGQEWGVDETMEALHRLAGPLTGDFQVGSSAASDDASDTATA